MAKTYVVEAKGDTGYGVKRLMRVDIIAATKTEAIKKARARAFDYFDRHDYKAGTLRYSATED